MKVKMLELLAPAGNLEKLKTAFYYGADACYFAGKRYGLRAFAGNFKEDELEESVKFVHSINKKAYITLNIIAHNTDFDGLKEYLLFLDSVKVDALIVADVGIIQFIRETLPDMPIHVSTQANITNKYSAKFFADMGVKRLILARELSLSEVKEISEFVSKDVEIETFIHGAMCISYSGRCLLSNYFTGRDSNRGACAQVCRWGFGLVDKQNPDNVYDIEEDERGTYILNSKDLNMIKHLHELVKAGVTSFKIEGRMKSSYYVANVVNAYRRALNYLSELKNVDDYVVGEELVKELEKSSHRTYTTGFYLNEKIKENVETSNPIQTSEFMAAVTEKLNGNKYIIEQRNKFVVGDELEILSPGNSFNKKFKVEELYDLENNEITVANQVQQKLIITCPYELNEGDILRTV